MLRACLPTRVSAVVMDEFQVSDRFARRFSTAATLVIFAAVIGGSYWWQQAYRRWCRENHPLAAPRAHVERLRNTYQQKREGAMEVATLAIDLYDELGRALKK